jgi:hypothetical protein
MVSVLLEQPPSLRFALFGHTQFRSENQGQVDSYDSSVGAYGGANIKSNGDLGTNGDTAGFAMQSFDAAATFAGDYWVMPGDTVSFATLPTGSRQEHHDPMELPHVTIPSSLTGIVGYSAPPAGCTGCSGTDFNYTVSGSWPCTTPSRVKSLVITGVFQMQAGCELLVDNTEGGWTGGPNALLDLNAAGTIVKTVTVDGSGNPSVSKIFVRDGPADLDGGGATFDSLITPAARRPELFQLYATCTTPPCTNTSIALRQRQPFYGIAYAEDGFLEVGAASENTVTFDATYYGAFVAGGQLLLKGIYRDQTSPPDGIAEPYVVRAHYDETLKDLSLDGTGARVKPYRVRRDSWLAIIRR